MRMQFVVLSGNGPALLKILDWMAKATDCLTAKQKKAG